MRMAERALARRSLAPARTRAPCRAGRGAPRRRRGVERPPRRRPTPRGGGAPRRALAAKRRLAAKGPLYYTLKAVTALMTLDVGLFRARADRTVLRAARETIAVPPHPLCRHRPDRARHGRRLRARTGGGRGPRRTGPRSARAGHARAWRVAARAGAMARRRRARRTRPLPAARGAGVTRVARAVEPDVVIERYHNFGGEGMLAARAVGARYVLEVNAPVVDYPGSLSRAWTARCSCSRCDAGETGRCAPPT